MGTQKLFKEIMAENCSKHKKILSLEIQVQQTQVEEIRKKQKQGTETSNSCKPQIKKIHVKSSQKGGKKAHYIHRNKDKKNSPLFIMGFESHNLIEWHL